MKKNNFNYNESNSSDSYEEAIDIDSGEKVEAKKTNKSQVYKAMCDWAEARRGFPFLSIPKQYKALAIARNAGIVPDRIKNRWSEMEEDRFWKEKGFDFMDVVRSFEKKQ